MKQSDEQQEYYVDPRVMGGLIKKYKKKSKNQKKIILISFLLILGLLGIWFFDGMKINRYERYLSQKIDTNIDSILLETTKTKYFLDEAIKGNGSIPLFSHLLVSLNNAQNSYRDTKNILFTAVDTVAPDKMAQVTAQLKEIITNLLQTNHQELATLPTGKLQQLQSYQSLYNDILHLNASLILKDVPPSTENNLTLFHLDLTNANTLQSSFQEKYNKSITYTLWNQNWIDLLVKSESTVVKHKLGGTS